MGNQSGLADDHRGPIPESNIILPFFVVKARTAAAAPTTAVLTGDFSACQSVKLHGQASWTV